MSSVNSCENVVFLCFLAQVCPQPHVVLRKTKEGNPTQGEHSWRERIRPCIQTPKKLLFSKNYFSNPTHQLSLMEKQLLTLVLNPQKSELACLEKLLILRGTPACV